MEAQKAWLSYHLGAFVNYASVTYNLGMIFIETPVFTKLIEQLLAHDNYVLIKEYLE